MSIVFTQYLMPRGRKQCTEIDMPKEIEALAQRFISAGGFYESEMLSDYRTVSLTACFEQPDGDNDIAIEIAQNGPAILGAVERLVRKSITWLEARL